MTNCTSWTAPEDEMLAACLKRGLSFGEMAPIVGRARNACIGRAHRLKLVADKALVAKRAQMPRTKRLAVTPKRPPPAPLTEPPALGARNDLVAPVGCNFIHGAIGVDAQFCGHPGSPWCHYHRSIVYVPERVRVAVFRRAWAA